MTYRIVRFFSSNRRKKIIRRGVSLKVAQQHCSDPKTRREGVWFDGYERE